MTNIFVGSTIRALEEDRKAVRGFVSGWRLPDHSRETISAGPDLQSALRDEIGKADLFLGIYASELPMNSSAPWYQELTIALERKSNQELLLFRQLSDSANWLDNDIWRKVNERDLIVPTFRNRESLLLHIARALAERTPKKMLRRVVEEIGRGDLNEPWDSQLPEQLEPHDRDDDVTLARIFDLGNPPYNLVYGRRSSKPREKYGSLQTAPKYFETYQRLQIKFPGIVVEPDVPHNALARHGAMLLSGPSTSDWSEKYFSHMAERGIEPFCGSCLNHLKEKCKKMSSACAPGRDVGATGCAYIAGQKRVYTFRDAPPAEQVKHVAMLIRSPSPWCSWQKDGGENSVPRVIFASGCHTQSGVLACRSITEPDSMRKTLAQLGWRPTGSEQPWFVTIVSQVAGEASQVEFAARIRIDDQIKWHLETPLEESGILPTDSSKTHQVTRAAKIFFSYSHKDETYKEELINHLSVLRRQGIIQNWHDRLIPPGAEWDEAIDENLRTADIILFLVSSDFIASNYIWKSEVSQAMELSESGEAIVIPVILRAVRWEDAPFGKLQALPTNAKPVVEWSSYDAGLKNVVEGIRDAIRTLSL